VDAEEEDVDLPPEPEPPEPEKFTANRLKDLWNEGLGPLGFPKVVKISPSRKTSFDARMNDDRARASPEWWREIIAKIGDSAFMRQAAQEKKAWLSFDWILNENNLVKVVEGKYSGRGVNDQPRASPMADADVYKRAANRDPDEILSEFFGENNDVIDAEVIGSG
jgi:hypothetical protein